MRCSPYTLTWYPGVLGATSDPLVLLSTSDHVDDGLIAPKLSQAIQSGEYLRGDQPDHWPRGQAVGDLAFTRILEVADPTTALENGLGYVTSLPEQQGWLKIQITGKATVWSLDKCSLASIEAMPKPSAAQLHVRYTLRGGLLAVYSGDPPATQYTPGELLDEESLYNDRGAILLE